MSTHESPYPPIADYAMIGDCQCTALVSRAGSVDWCCMPRLDDDSCFGRLLDWEQGGFCKIAPEGGDYTSSRRYLPETMILETRFCTADGEALLLDFFTVDIDPLVNPRYDLVRIVQGVRGQVPMRLEVCPRFDYGEIKPHMKQHKNGIYTATGSNKGLVIRADIPLTVRENRDLAADFTVAAGQKVRLTLEAEFPELLDQAVARASPNPNEVDQDLERTRKWWADWAHRMRAPFALDGQTLRSTIILKSLTFERTGAIAAAATTSLPEWIGGGRNWDYRFSWVRDSVFTVRALYALGYAREADRFHQFIQRSSAGSANELQIMYGVDGKRRLTEIELNWMEGYRGSRPVRIGNGAAKQVQFDIFGELLEMAWEWQSSGHPTDPDYWNFLVDVVNTVCAKWQEHDHGIWEVRGPPASYVHSKVMCWAALNRGIMLAQANRLPAPVDRWADSRDAVRSAIETHGYDTKRGIFMQTFENGFLDAALLLLPRVGFVAYDDPRMLRTADAICHDLDRNGLLLRYNAPDNLPGPEGIFLPCTFWLANCLAYQGQHERAWEYYRRAVACANDLGLFSEEYDVDKGEMLGNFPQGLTHVSQIMAWLALAGK